MYDWEAADLEGQSLLSLQRIEAKLEKRRKQLMAKLPFDGDMDKSTGAVDEATIKEWLALTMQRDKVAKLKVTKANEAEFSACVSRLHGVLGEVKQFEDQHFPPALRQGVAALLTETSKYLSQTKQEAGDAFSQENIDTVDVGNLSPIANHTSPTDLKPFTPLRLPDFSRLKTPRGSVSARRSSRKITTQQRQASPSPATGIGAKFAHSTPTAKTAEKPKNSELRKSLLKSREGLRRTPGVTRSPGRTPYRQRRLDPSDPADMVTAALRRKFQNVRKLYASPSTEPADTSINISID